MDNEAWLVALRLDSPLRGGAFNELRSAAIHRNVYHLRGTAISCKHDGSSPQKTNATRLGSILRLSNSLSC